MSDPREPRLAPATSHEVIATQDDDGERIDVVLGRHIAALSRRKARELALQGRVRLNGQRAAPSQRVSEQDRLVLSIQSQSTPDGPQPVLLAVTPHVVYVDKPAGWHVYDLRLEGRSLAAWLEHLHPECASASIDAREGGAVHRLDAATSGVVAFARDRTTYQTLREAFADGRVRKRYIATCERHRGEDDFASATSESPSLESASTPSILPADSLPGWLMTRALEPSESQDTDALCSELNREPSPRLHLIRAPLGPAPGQKLVHVRLDGRRAQTRLMWLGLPATRALAFLWLDTGERHQLRVHLAWAGFPIIGDESYGGAEFERLCLHAQQLDLSAALEGERAVISPVPPPLLRALTLQTLPALP